MRLKKPNGKIIHVVGENEGAAKKQDVLFNTAPDAHCKAHRHELFEGLDGANLSLINKFWRN
ncbi:MAG: hypothetical protein IJ424_06285 [Oscillospiraceae bacterium]|nr:hypothetical protein [Oscillospiraceae bacterium]